MKMEEDGRVRTEVRVMKSHGADHFSQYLKFNFTHPFSGNYMVLLMAESLRQGQEDWGDGCSDQILSILYSILHSGIKWIEI